MVDSERKTKKWHGPPPNLLLTSPMQELWDVDIAATANVIDQVASALNKRWSSSSDKGSRTKLSKVISLIYSKPTKGGSYKLPYYDFFSLELEPLIKTVKNKYELSQNLVY